MTWLFQVSDEQAMWRVQRGDDHAAFAQLVGRWETPVRRLCTRMTGDLQRGEDLAQEAFTRVFARRHDYQPPRRFSTWLWQITVNLCRDDLRRRQRRPEVRWEGPGESDHGESAGHDPAAPIPSPAEALEKLERAEQVRRALLQLPETGRTVVILRHYEGLKFIEIAEVLGIPEGTVKSRMADALTRLARLLPPDA